MKKLLLFLCLMVFSLGQSQSIDGTWKVTSIGVGPSQGDTGWWGLSVGSGQRACFFDDQYVFSADGTFQNVQGTQTWNEWWQGGGDGSCGTPVAPHNGSNAATFTATATTLTLNGVGAYLGLSKVINGSEITNSSNAPSSITYQIAAITSTSMTVDINVGAAWWRYVLAKEGATPPPSNVMKITTTVCGASPTSVVRLTGPWWGWDPNAGPIAVNNGDETWTFTFDPAPTADMEYLILKDGVQENLIGKGDCSPITDYWSYANRQWTVGSGNVSNVYNSCSACIDYPISDAPTPIARNAWDVISLYSGAYTNLNSNFFPNWGQSTSFSNFTPVSDPTIKYSNLTYQGIEIINGNASVNVSAMTKLHLDVWTPEITSFKISLIAAGENAVTLTPTLHGWNSFDIDLATQFAGRDLTAAIQLKLERVGGGTSSLYLDNIYFYRPATTQPPTLGNFTVPAKVVGDADFNLTAPTSNSSGAFTYTSSNTSVATISGSTVTIVGAGSTTITATQEAAGTYATISVIATLEVSLAAAAPTPTVPADRVLSLFSDAYTNVAGTDWRPNWGQSTQYNLVNVVGNPTIKYSNLNYEGVQLASEVNVTSYSTLHLDVYGAGTSAVDFYLVNQVGPAGSGINGAEQSTTLTLTPGVWNSFDIPLSSFTGIALNRIGQFKLVGSGTIYVDNIYFTKPTPSHTTAPTVSDVTYCKGATASTLTATASGSNLLKWYSTATIATALPTVPKPVTTISGTKKYYVAQVMSDGFVSPRAEITVTVTTDAVPATPTALTTSDAVICKYFGTTSTVTYTATAAGAASYVWTVPTGVNIVSTLDNTITVNFADVALNSVSSIGSIGVKAVNAAGCTSVAAKSLVLTPALPTAPTTLVLSNGVTSTAITAISGYLGTSTELTLTAAAAATGTSYEWILPSGVNQMSGGTGRIITVNFSGASGDLTALPISVKTVAGCGKSVVKTLSLTRALPTAPSAVIMTNGTTATAITAVGPFIGTSTELTLTATPNATASSYQWTLPDGVNKISGGNSNVIKVNFANVSTGTTSLVITVNSVNACGTSTLGKTLTLTRVLPAKPGTITASTTNVCAVVGTSNNVTYTVAEVAGAFANGYIWTVPTGASIVGSTNGNSIAVSYSSDYTAAGTVTVKSSNGVGTSATAASLSITRVAPALPASISGGTTYSSCNQTFSTPEVSGAAIYTWTVPTGATIVSGQNTNTVVVNYGSLRTAQTIKVKITNGCGLSSAVKSLSLTYSACSPAPIVSNTSTEEMSKVSITEMYPNPTTDNFNVELTATKSGSVSVAVYSFDGLVVSSKNILLSEGSNMINEDLTSQRSGIYVVKITNETTGEVTIKKIIKQ